MSDTSAQVKWEPTTMPDGVRYFWRAEVNDGALHHFAYFVSLGEAIDWAEALLGEEATA